MPKSRKARVPDEETLRRITTRAVAEIVPHQEFVDGLRSGRPLRLKMGFDPTRPVITLGWAAGLRKLRQLQDLGHTVVVIIGDWTARIGDPSEESQTRPMLTEEEVNANCEAILPQFYKVLDERRTEIRRQSEWFDKFGLTDVVRLAARFTVAQMLQRDDFAQRYAERKPIGLHELLYPLLQAYDSVAVEADVEFGGTDQKFNNLVGRELQRTLGQKAGPAGEGQAVFLVPLLVGLDGKQKMSQSLGNYIAVDDPPHEMYGKLMSIPDSLMVDYFELLTDVPDEELAGIRASVEEGGAKAMEHKLRLAREVVTQFHSAAAAQEAEEGFVRVFRKGELPDDVQEVTLTDDDWRELVEESLRLQRLRLPPDRLPERFSSMSREEQAEALPWITPSGEWRVSLPLLLVKLGLLPSRSEARRKISEGAVEIDGKVCPDVLAGVRSGSVIRVGKHRFLRIVDADKQPQD